MLTNNHTRPTTTALLAVLLAGGLLLTQSASAVVQDSQPAQATGAPKQGVSTVQPKVSPYTKMNRQRSQANATGAMKAPHPATPHGTRKATGGARRS